MGTEIKRKFLRKHDEKQRYKIGHGNTHLWRIFVSSFPLHSLPVAPRWRGNARWRSRHPRRGCYWAWPWRDCGVRFMLDVDFVTICF